MSEKAIAKETATMRRIAVSPDAPRAAHLILWTRVGEQIVLEVGYFDLVGIREQESRNPSGERVVDWYVTNKFLLDIESAERIIESFDQLRDDINKLKAAGKTHASD